MKRLLTVSFLLTSLGLAASPASAQFSTVSPPSIDLSLVAGESASVRVSIRIDPFCVRPIPITLAASDPDAVVQNPTGTVVNSCGGDVSAFVPRITGVGVDQSFDLQFVDAETGSALDTIPVTITSAAAATESLGESPTLLSCFYDCGPRLIGGWREITTLLLANPGNSAAFGRVIYYDGNANAIGLGSYNLAPDDLDEIHVCATLDAAGIPPPRTGLVHLTVARGGGAYAWVKNWTGRFTSGGPEPSLSPVLGVGKTECRVVAPSVGTAGEAASRAVLQNPPTIESILIGGTAD